MPALHGVLFGCWRVSTSFTRLLHLSELGRKERIVKRTQTWHVFAVMLVGGCAVQLR